MTQIVINTCYGGFGLSEEAVERYFEIKGWPLYKEYENRFKSLNLCTYWRVPKNERVKQIDWGNSVEAEREAYNQKYSEQTFYERDVDRDDPILIQVVKELGKEANGRHASLKIVSIPDDVDWNISDYDGIETIEEVRRSWS
jgi:hypothetical protein